MFSALKRLRLSLEGHRAFLSLILCRILNRLMTTGCVLEYLVALLELGEHNTSKLFICSLIVSFLKLSLLLWIAILKVFNPAPAAVNTATILGFVFLADSNLVELIVVGCLVNTL